jgi:iron complex outermembrane receptor protein
VGAWLERSLTTRHTYDLDWTLGLPNPKEATAPKTVAYEQNSEWSQYEPFVEFDWTVLDSLTITPGLKYVHFDRGLNAAVNQGTRTPAQFDKVYTTTLPFLTANYRIDPSWSAYGQSAKGFLAPDLNLFYVNDPSKSSAKPQTSTNYQLGVVHQSASLAFDADVYYIDFNDKVASTGSGNDIVFYNQGGVIYKGIEAAVTYYLGQGFSLHANGSLNSAKAKDTGLQIGKAPASTSAIGLLYKANGLYGSLMAKTVGTQYGKDGEPAAYRIAASTVTDGTIGYRLRVNGNYLKAIKLQAGVNNLFNKQDVTSITANSKGVAFDQYTFVPARSWTVSLSADY